MASPSACGLSFPGAFYTKPRFISSSSSSSLSSFPLYPLRNPNKRLICRAEFSQDAPLATAIGACILSSFVFPVAKRVEEEEEEEEENSAIVSTDMRLAAMGIISFIPYFNWLSWVFAWLDTGKTRYSVYALVYLLPYLSSNLSISPEDSWLPITSIVLGIIHVQLEASIANGDFGFFINTSKKIFHFHDKISSEEDKEEVSMPKEVSTVPISDSDKFVYQILNGPNEHCLENFRMEKPVFYKLCDILQTRGLLRHTNRIKIEEQLAIFLFIIGHNLRTRAVQELFRYSGETISRHFNNVLNAVMSISIDFFQSNPNVDETLQENDPYFKDCVGVVDCIHIPVMVGVDEQGPFRNNNGVLTQNVLVASSFDLRFHYVLAGWEGSASDQQVLNAALTRPNKLQVPQGKYYIVDNKYQNLPGFIAPYHGVSTNSRDEPKEIFNERHRLLHRAIDRTFGALKQRFPILLSAPPYPLQTQVKLVIAACALHNYVRLEKPDDLVFKMFEDDTIAGDGEVMVLEENLGETDGHEHGFRPEEVEDCLRLRDEIASHLWDHYVQNLSTF